MAKQFEKKLFKTKKLDKDTTLKISKNEAAGRIFVEFSTNDGKLVVQKSFQDTYFGNKEADEFAGKIKSLKDLKTHLGFDTIVIKEFRNVIK